MVWEVWKEKNRRIFKEKAMPRDCLIKKIEGSITELVNSFARLKLITNNIFSCWDDKMAKIFSGLVIPKLLGDNDKGNKRRL